MSGQVDTISPTQLRCWLSATEPDNRPHIRSTMTSSNRRVPAGCEITISNLTPAEFDAIQACLLGASYIRVVNGRLHAFEVFEELPPPQKDPLVGPHWASDGTIKEWGGIPAGEGWHSPGLIITGLGAGITSATFQPERKRQRDQDLLEECGFTCLRSRRSREGRFWEQWVLHGLWQASGPLKKHMSQFVDDKKLSWVKEAEEAARYITETLHVNYGSLDITIQRWHLSFD
jgi:hypothetical protein